MLNMGIIKIEVSLPELFKAVTRFKNNRLKFLEELTTETKHAVSRAINNLLKTELALFLGGSDQADNKRNGYEKRNYTLKGIGQLQLRMPIDRKRAFKSVLIPPREQVDPRLKEDLAVLHLAGISTRTLSLVSHRILGLKVSADTVTKSLGLVEEQALAWLERPLGGEDYWALFIDGTNFRIQRRDSTEKEPSLVVLGLNSHNCLSILSIQPGQKDNADSWREVFSDLKKRGLNAGAVRIGIMDGLPGLEKAFLEAFDQAVTARCWVHALKNAMAKVSKRLSEPFKMLAHKVMYASSENEARLAFNKLKESMGNDAHLAVRCLEKDLDSLLAHYRFDRTLWRTLKTTNPIERVNKELKRRAKVMEGLGERTLRVLTAFTALRLEYNWRKTPTDSNRILNLKGVKQNELELTMKTLIK